MARQIAGTLAAAAFAAAPCAASEFEKSIVFYGLVDASVALEKAAEVRRVGFDAGELDGSRIGVRGSTVFDEGLSALFVLEAGFDAGTGESEQSDRLLGRQAFAGLQGTLGRVTAGRQYSPAFVALDPLESTGGAVRSAGLLHRKSGSVRRGYETRFDNMVKYRSPDLAGFVVDAGYWVGDENASADSDVRKEGSGTGIAALFDNDWLSLALVTQRQYTDDTGGKATTHGAGIAVDFGALKLYLQGSRDIEAGSQGTGEARTASLGARIRFSRRNTVAISVAKRDESGEAGAMDASGATVYYLRALDRETLLYLGYSRLDNKAGADYGWYIDPAPGADPAAFMVGLRHKF